MGKITKTYAKYNGIPLCKTWDDDICINISPTSEEIIQKHNTSPLECNGINCITCNPKIKPLDR